MTRGPQDDLKTHGSPRVTRAVSRFWEERAKGRSVSVDEVLETNTAGPEYQVTRATAIQVIASQAAALSGAAEVTPEEKKTVAWAVGESSADSLAASGPLPQIEGYDLVGCLGRGGMGAVYEGYQRSTGRRVAVKFMLDAMAGAEAARKRFEREVEVVARLQHPGIVSVLDSGVRKGRYFYVMEFVPGRSLDAAFKPGECPTRQVLELIARVCDAVDYAHQRGVLHRDLKPSNVIVDEQGDPHLLDFGLAKTFDPTQGDGGTHGALGLTVSGPGQLLGTVAYMSPEQAQGKHDETSVRTDVYSLAAIAYELLTGKLPSRMGKSLAETLAGIIGEDPQAPSALRPGLSRDLDAVLLRALEKVPERRYATAGEFAADVRRHLAGEPVLARRVSPAGRAWRWVRRNQAISAVTLTAVLTLAAVSALLVTKIVRERDQARASFALLKGTLESADPEKNTAENPIIQVLDGAGERIALLPKGREGAETDIRETIGLVYRKFGEYQKARANQARVLDIREARARGRDDPAVADALHNLAATLWWDGKYADAESLYTRSLEMRRRLYAGDHPAVAMSLTHLAACRLRMGKTTEARALYREALDIRRRLYGAEHEEVAMSLNNLAKCSMDAQRFEEAEDLFRQSLAMIRRLKGDAYGGTAAVSQNLGDCLLRRAEAVALRGDASSAAAAAVEAKEPLERALHIRAQMYPRGHHLLAVTLCALGRAELLAGDLVQAGHRVREGVDMLRRTRVKDPDHPDFAEGLEALGLVLLAENDTAAAADALGEALRIATVTRPVAAIQVARLRGELGEARLRQGRTDEAEAALLQAYEETSRLHGDVAPETALAARRLETLYTTVRKDDEKASRFRTLASPHP